MEKRNDTEQKENDRPPSKYAAKKAKREEALALPGKQGGLEETAESPDQEPQQEHEAYPVERFYSPDHPVFIDILYISKNGNNGVLLRPSARICLIHSCLIRSIKGRPQYGINKEIKDRIVGHPIIETEFQRIYKDPWMLGNRYAQIQLHSIEQAIEARRENIESHLQIKVRPKPNL